MVNNNSKRKKREYKPIPLTEIPQGIQLCIKNAERLYDDGKFLSENNRVQSAKVNLILAKEEFAKALFLLSWYKQKKSIPKTRVKEYFQFHLVRLKEFKKYLGDIQNLPVSIFEPEYDRMMREYHTYVDWKGKGNWFSPINMVIEPFFEMPKMDLNWAEKFDLETAYTKLSKDEDFQRIMKMKRSRPPSQETHLIIEKIIGKNIPTKTEVTNDRILVKIKPKQEVTRNQLEEIRESLDKKYSNYKVKVRFGE